MKSTLSLPLIVALTGSVALAEELPQLGRSATADVVAALTDEEKVGLVMGTGFSFPGLPPAMQAPAVGQTDAGVPGAAGTTLAVPRLGIPSIVLADGPAGLRIAPERDGVTDRTFYCTAFPIATLLASSWDTELVERVGRAMGAEVKEYGVDVLLAPALNLHRNPLGGRNFEYYSEDPLVGGRMAAAIVRGVQSQGVGTSIKHYVANNHEWNRNTIDVVVGQRPLRELYLRGFEIAVREGRPWTLMSSYNKVNGLYTSESGELLRGVLRRDWGFDGVVMTDWFGGADAVAQMQAGNELLMPGTGRQREVLLEALESGALSSEVLDRNVALILDLIQRTPAFLGYEHSDSPDLEAHARVGREAAAQGMVLLRNEGVLPLAEGARVALLGNSSYRMITGGTGSGDVNEAYTISLQQGLEAAGVAVDTAAAESYAAYIEEQEAKRPPAQPFRLPPPIAERKLEGAEIERLAAETDLALFTLGRNSGEFADRQLEGDFLLSEDEQALIQALSGAYRAQGKKLLVVLNVGGVIESASWRDATDAILLAWLPGQEAGHAVADVLTGRIPPSGRLATTFPMSWDQLPSSKGFPGKTLLGPDPEARGPFAGDRAAEVVYQEGLGVGYRYFAGAAAEPAWPFGYGLGYTRFEHAALEVDAELDGALHARVRVTNAGERAGREVVQVYLTPPGGSRPALELRAFAKTRTLEPGESQTLEFVLGGRDLAHFDEGAAAWVAPGGTWSLKVGASSADIRQSASFEVPETFTVESVSTAVGAGHEPSSQP